MVLALADDKRRLGDKAAKTIVVKNPNKVSRILRTLSLIVTAIAFVAIILVVISSAMKNSGAYKIAVQEIEQNEKIIQSVGEIKGYGFMPTGSINIVNGFGEAQLQIKVIGHERNESIYVYLTKEPEQEWKLIEMY